MSRMVGLLMILLSLTACKSQEPEHLWGESDEILPGKYKVPIREFQAVAGEEAQLPCTVSIPREPDVLSLITWHRGTSPVYTLDFRRSGSPEEARHFPGKPLEGRARFDTALRPPTLRIRPVRVEDEGLYLCRIEFKRARTVSRPISLVIIVPPLAVAIMDDRGRKLKRLAGPYDEGAPLSLICEAEGGSPAPSVTWWRDGVLLDDTSFRTAEGSVRNELSLGALRRRDLMAEIACRASNTNLTNPLNATLTIDLNMRPLYVRITTAQRALRAGEELRLDCETSGSRPPAQIGWWLEGRALPRQQSFTNRNVSYGSLHLHPLSLADNGKVVECRAHNPALPHATHLHDTWTLNVLFPPEVSLQFGASINPSSIREGNDVYLECGIRANPPATELAWFFEGLPFQPADAGVLFSNQSLVLQRVKKEHRGRYRCEAANSEGRGTSENVLLEVRYAPSCKVGQKSVYGVRRGEEALVSCEVSADPQVASFRWALNNSVEQVALQDHSMGVEGTTSVLRYTPGTMLEFGAVLCWATNAVGEQREPCVSRVIPAGPPDPVRDCRVSNRSTTWLWVECEAGYDGGLPQRFHLDAYDAGVRRLQRNATATEAPSFSLDALPPATPFVLVLYAQNEKGKSNSVAIVAATNGDQRQEAGGLGGGGPLVVIVVLSVLGTLLLLLVVALAIVRVRKKKKTPKAPPSIEEDKIKLNKIPKKPSDELIGNTVACPDVVPPNNVCDIESLESAITKDGQSPDSAKCSRNYRNCVVALKRSWSLKKRCQEKGEIEVSLSELNYPDELTRIPLSPTTTIVHDGGQWFEPPSKPPILMVVEDSDGQNGSTTNHTALTSI